MASKPIFGLVLMWLYLVFSNPINGREIPKDEDMESKTTQMASGSNVLVEKASPPNFLPLDDDDATMHWAVYRNPIGEYYGTQAEITVYGLPEIKVNQVSAAVIWISNGQDAIQSGWHVRPDLYGDSHTHFYTYWTSDDYGSTGCYNLQCQGFVMQKSSKIVPGTFLERVSTYYGEQYYISLTIWKDSTIGVWWLYYFGEPVGYWPNYLFTSLANSASYVSWGGFVGYPKNGNSPPMGSGHLGTEREGNATAFKHIAFMDVNGYSYNPEIANAQRFTDVDECYNVTPFYDSNLGGGIDGHVFYFGGPGQCAP